MSVRVRRVMVVAAGLLWLGGCSTFKLPESLSSPSDTPSDATTADPTTTGTVADPLAEPPATPELLGKDPNDDLSIGKKYFRQGSYGLAERHFRKAVELHPKDAESWIGLAASYDRLRRFDHADRAYEQAIRLIGPTPEILNNQGFSYMLRGDYKRARATLLAARAKDPTNAYIANNLALLNAVERKRKAVN